MGADATPAVPILTELLKDKDEKVRNAAAEALEKITKEKVKALTPGTQGRTWVSIAENGDKVGVALVLIEKAGKATSGKMYVLDAVYPRDLSKGVGYGLRNVRHEGKTITGDVSVWDYSSTPRTKEIHLTILLKDGFEGERVLAEMLQEGSDTKVQIVFVREKGG
jgi:hypothetical protein